MKGLYVTLFVTFATFLCCYGDVYMHNPRGSNNRLNEKSANRANANRLFDSQNNNRGGYNKGDKTKDPAGNDKNKQYHMKYFQSAKNAASYMVMELTNQHGFGVDNKKLISNIVVQYMCQEASITGKNIEMRDGVQTGTQPFSNGADSNNKAAFEGRRNQVNANLGLHEPYENYDRCNKRTRNKGLFIADQKLNNVKATRTRQNPNGNRRGYECPEERDYHPYWHPNPWKDAAVLVSDPSRCDFYKKESFNVMPRHECVQNNIQSSVHNNQEACEKDGGVWTEFHNYLEVLSLTKQQCESNGEKNKYKNLGHEIIWANIYDHDNRKEKCIVKLKEPECLKGEFTRVNHLGNTVNLKMLKYKWKIPHFPSDRDHKCVVRFRYNITTADYDPWNTDSKSNNENLKNVNPPQPPLVENDPEVDVGVEGTPLQLAINTAQFGRTFQDRSHVLILATRKDLPSSVKSKVIHNLNVRGKRGNIVQTYPAIEYDFIPNKLSIKSNELIHIQWTGSNTHNNGNPAGDGQAGDDGEGKAGTDRNNMLGLKDLNYNFPMTLEEKSGFFQKCTALWKSLAADKNLNKLDVAIQFASSGYYHCETASKCQGNSVESKAELNPTLDTSPASFEGAIFQCPVGTYHTVCTRNNNFSNRSQKGTIVVKN